MIHALGLGFRMKGLEFRFWSLRLGVQELGFGVGSLRLSV
jgi:hypothetical protein